MKIQPFEKFHKEWALVSAGNVEDFNTMTVSWGTMGTLWNKSIVTVFVKPIRYTYNYLNDNEYFTVSFFNEEYKKDLAILGSKSKRDCDKMSLTKLHAKDMDGNIDFEEENCTILCKKIYYQDLDLSQIPEDAVQKYYLEEAPHRMYIGVVVKIIER